MLSERKIRTSRYVIAGLLTLLIFVLGLLLGFVIEGERIGYIKQENTMQKLDFNSLQAQYAYMDQLGAERDCDKLKKTFEQSVNNLETARIKLVSYSEGTQTNEFEFDILKREYMIDQIQYWLFSKRVNQLCKNGSASILYFYSTIEKCPDCQQQEFVLTYLKKRLGDKLLNFGIDSEYTQEPMINLLKVNYGVTTFPTLIIEGKKVDGFASKEQILSEICKKLKDSEDCLEFNSRQSVN